MKPFIYSLKIGAICLSLLTLLLGIGYPVATYCIGQLFFHKEANGSIVQIQKQQIGSSLIGQNFTGKQYFHPRPSAAGNGYDAANSSGSNLGPTSQKLIQAIESRANDYRAENNLGEDELIPADAVTSSASGLDPHISLKNASLQAPRIASSRGMALNDLQALIEKYTDDPTFWLLGEPRVNVLLLNLELDGKQ